ncbi:hypothetical protein LDENG_00238630 [Lucifuga dentata]|nr:hypothetical protein LDENG_00238630 [Lucifuga dentata]
MWSPRKKMGEREKRQCLIAYLQPVQTRIGCSSLSSDPHADLVTAHFLSEHQAVSATSFPDLCLCSAGCGCIMFRDQDLMMKSLRP